MDTRPAPVNVAAGAAPSNARTHVGAPARPVRGARGGATRWPNLDQGHTHSKTTLGAARRSRTYSGRYVDASFQLVAATRWMVDHGRVLLSPPRHSPTSDPSLRMTGERLESIPLPFSTTTGCVHGPPGLVAHAIHVWSLDRPYTVRALYADGGVEPSPGAVQLEGEASFLNAGLQLPDEPAGACGSHPVQNMTHSAPGLQATMTAPHAAQARVRATV